MNATSQRIVQAPTRGESSRPAGRRRWAAVALVVCLAVPLFIGPASAGADDVTDLEARADRIAQQLMDLQGRIGELGEQFNQSQVRRTEIAAKKADIEQRSRAARLEVVARRADATRYAMSAYVGLDEGDVLSLALDGRQWDLSRRTGYAAIRIGDREQIVDNLQAAQQANADLVAALAAANRAEEKIAADLERQQDEATRLIAEQEKLQNSVQGRLADAVARRQAAIAAAQQAEAAATTTPGSTAGTQPGGTGAAGSPGSSSAGPTAASPAAPSVAGPAGPAGTTAPPASPGATQPPATTRPPAAPSPTQPAPPPTTAAPSPPPSVTPPATDGGNQTVANAAISQLGVRYSWGGGTASGPSMGFGPGAGIVGFDCSGLTLYAWAQVGVSLPHSAQMQYNRSAKVSLSQLRPGDLVFYGSSSGSITHVSVYVGGGQVVHAPNSRSVVQYGAVNLWSGYYSWIGAGRPG